MPARKPAPRRATKTRTAKPKRQPPEQPAARRAAPPALASLPLPDADPEPTRPWLSPPDAALPPVQPGNFVLPAHWLVPVPPRTDTKRARRAGHPRSMSALNQDDAASDRMRRVAERACELETETETGRRLTLPKMVKRLAREFACADSTIYRYRTKRLSQWPRRLRL